jgi:hypothetical protein
MPTSFKNISFESHVENYFPQNQFTNNSIFKLPIWKANQRKSCNEVLIMINGFLEGVEIDQNKLDRHLERYEAIAKKILKEKNITSVMLPLPFHFNRSRDIKGDNQFAPISRLTKSGTYLYYGGFTQVVSDVKKLINDIENNPLKFGLTVTDNIKFHLLGYSLGGVAAIGSALHLERKLDSLTILLSAWNLSEINPEAINKAFGKKFGLTTELGTRMIEELKEIKEKTDPVFKKLIWNEGEPIAFNKCAERVFFLNGFKDDIFTNSHTEESRKQVLEVMEKCTFINIPSDHHAFRSREAIAGYVSTFICNR